MYEDMYKESSLIYFIKKKGENCRKLYDDFIRMDENI